MNQPRLHDAAQIDVMQRTSAALRRACEVMDCAADDLPLAVGMRLIEAAALKGDGLSIADIRPLLSKKRAKYLTGNPAKALARIEWQLTAVRAICEAA